MHGKVHQYRFVSINFTYVGVLLNNNIKNLVASCDKSLYKYSNLYLTNVIFCLVSLSLVPRNGDIPESSVYVITPSDHISEYGYAGSSHKISGAFYIKKKKLYRGYYQYIIYCLFFFTCKIQHVVCHHHCAKFTNFSRASKIDQFNLYRPYSGHYYVVRL